MLTIESCHHSSVPAAVSILTRLPLFATLPIALLSLKADFDLFAFLSPRADLLSLLSLKADLLALLSFRIGVAPILFFKSDLSFDFATDRLFSLLLALLFKSFLESFAPLGLLWSLAF